MISGKGAVRISGTRKGDASHPDCEFCQRVRPERCPGHQVQGEVMRGFIAPGEPTPDGGDVWLFEFTSGLTMRLAAEPGEAPWLAELDLQVIRTARSVSLAAQHHCPAP